MEPNQEHEQAATANTPEPPPRPKQPEQSSEDTDSGWGERPDPSDDERLYGDRPPHWDSI